MSLRQRMMLFVVFGALAVATALGGIVVQRQHADAEAEVQRRTRAFLGVLAVRSTAALSGNRTEELYEALIEVFMQHGGVDDLRYVAIVDRDREVIAHSNPLFYGTVFNDEFTRDAAASHDVMGSTIGRGDTHMLLMSMPIVTAIPGHDGIRWGTVVAAVSLEQVALLTRQLITHTILISLLVAAITGALAWGVLDNNIIRPLLRLTQLADDFAGGNFSARAHMKRHDEIALLGNTFNAMALRIQQHAATLERCVKERTSELSETNVRLSATTAKLEEANRQLEQLATVDGMTGLRNFRYFRSFLDQELHRSLRTGAPISLLMIDVDHFKNYNDTHGHPAGDEVLRQLAGILTSRLRAIDLPCRYGGEEFAVVLLDTNKSRAVAVADELRHTVATTPFANEHTQPGGRLSISVGVATSLIDAKKADVLIEHSDKALYRAKRAGRDRVIAWTSDPPEDAQAAPKKDDAKSG